eukprot:jgi/Botrbrau1/3352/Bobra.0048s0046.1
MSGSGKMDSLQASPVKTEDLSDPHMEVDGSDVSVGHKRHRNETDAEESAPVGTAKRLATAPRVTFRILCPVSSSGRVLGKGGETIKRLRQDNRCRIRIEDPIRGCTERVVTIQSVEADPEGHDAAEKMLLTVYRKIVGDGDSRGVLIRLLVERAYVGGILGTAGSVIKETRQKTGADIRFLKHNERPACALNNDEVLEVSGPPRHVEHALDLIARQLTEKTLRKPMKGGPLLTIIADRMPQRAVSEGSERGPPSRGRSPQRGPGPSTFSRMPVPCSPVRIVCAPQAKGSEGFRPLPDPPPLVETIFRLIVPTPLIGMLLGRNGNIIKQIRSETGARVIISSETAGEPERIVTVSSADSPTSTDCPAAQALLRCCAHLLPSDKPREKYCVRLLVPPWQVNPLMGRDEYGLHELRRSTGADIEVYTPDGIHTAPTADDIVEVSGAPEPCLNAMARIATILRNKQVLDRAQPLTPRSSDTPTSQFVPRGNRFRDGPGFPGPPPVRGGYDSDPGPPSKGLPLPPRVRPEFEDRRPEPRRMSLLRRNSMDTGRGPASYPQDREGPHPQQCMLISLSKAQAGCIIGKGGIHINQIRQISGARLKLFESPLANGDRRLELAGTQSQVLSARNLIQGYLLASNMRPLPDKEEERS